MIKAAHHIHIDTGQDGLARGGHTIIGDAVRHEFLDGFPVGVDHAAESPLLAEHLRECEGVGRGGHAVDRVERAHDGRRAGVDCRVEWWQVELAERMFRDFRRVVFAAGFGRAVADVMLRAGGDAAGRIEAFALVAAHVGGGHDRTEEGIFAGAFGNATPAGIAGDVDHRREGPADTRGSRFTRGNARRLLHHRRVPGGGQPQWNGKFGAEAVNDVEPKHHRNVQARFLHRNALVGVGFLGRGDIEERADLPPGQHVVVVGAAGTWTGGLAGRVLHELADLFFQRHLPQQSLHFRIDPRVVDTRVHRDGRGGNRCRRNQERKQQKYSVHGVFLLAPIMAPWVGSARARNDQRRRTW